MTKRKIVGITVGTPTSPKAMAEKLHPVTRVNGTQPDENGNLSLKVSDLENDAEYLTDSDKGKIAEYVISKLPVYDGEVVDA